MKATAGCLVILTLLSCRVACAEEKFIFPSPFSMDSPVSPYRDGGVDFRFMHTDDLSAISFPLVSRVASESRVFFAQVFLPLTVAVPSQGKTLFGFGDPRIGVFGSWRFDMPFGGGIVLPAAVAAGCDINLPFSTIWGDLVNATSEATGDNVSYAANAAGMAMYAENPVGWVPAFFGFNPRAMLAVGPEVFFGEFALGFPILVPLRFRSHYHDDLFLSWSVVAGTQPLDFLALTAEFSGISDLTHSQPINGAFEQNQSFFTFGSRFMFGKFSSGFMIRVPMTDQWALTGGGHDVIIGLYVGGRT